MSVPGDRLAALIERFLSGEIDRDDLDRLASEQTVPYVPVEDFARVDIGRSGRTGVPEFIYAPGKTVEQIAAIAGRMVDAGIRNVLATRTEEPVFRQLALRFPEARYHPLSRLVVFNPAPQEAPVGNVGIVTAGTSDLPVAEEADIVCGILGSRTTRISDIGVACLARTLDAVPVIETMNVVVCVAGMEATLPSVLAGLVPVPIIAVPTSVGYGVNAGGFNALCSILGSCAPGILAVNIDNGIGAATAAHRINFLVERQGR